MNNSVATHTVVVSDIHLADAEPPCSKGPLWKKFKNSEFYIDQSFQDLLNFIQDKTDQPVELILNGDILDFDSVMTLPKVATFKISWLERKRGLNPEELKSHFKVKTILDTHPVWVEAIRQFIQIGNRVVFVIGNHDIELHWPLVQHEIRARFNVSESDHRVIFADWFYISNQDTLIEHGNQYDHYSICTNPINPFIQKHNVKTLRLPFGNLAGKFMLNGMGLMNPHSENSYIKNSVWGYASFFYKYILKIQPFIMLDWMWGALVTLYVTITEGLHSTFKDPLKISDRIDAIATRANTNHRVVLGLNDLHTHPAAFNPIQLLKELWLDRALLFVFIILFSFEFYILLNTFAKISFWFFVAPFILLMPFFVFYARSIRSGIQASLEEAYAKLPLAAKIANVNRIIHGHTHVAMNCQNEGIEYLNTGTWSPAFFDVECTKAYGKKCFAWIHPNSAGQDRVAELYEWKENADPIRLFQALLT